MKKINTILNSKLFTLILLTIIFIPAFADTISIGYFPMHDDLQAMRQLIMDKCFRDGQIPCRWSEDMGYEFGYPIFNFYPPLPYYIGQIVHWVGFSFVDTVKVLVVLNFLVSGLAMYLLAKEFWGKWGGIISATFYVYAPYHAVDIYVRAAMNEAWALAFFPIIFWSIYKLIDKNKWSFVPIVSLSTALLMLSHNPILMIFSPLAIAWTCFWLIWKKNIKVLSKLLVSGVWAIGLAAFFTLPVVFEQRYVHVESLVVGYFNYLAHFASLNELFVSRFWGYGSSRFGPVDDLSFQVGYFHWILSLVSLLVVLKLLRKNLKYSTMILMLFILTTFFTFMSHERSSFIWEKISILQYLQFPWRFLTLTIFGTSFLAGSLIFLVGNVSEKIKVILSLILIVATIFFYKGYFHWEQHWPWVTDQVKFEGELWRLQITSGIFDYLPKWAPLPPPNPPNGNAEIVEGEGEIVTVFKNSIRQEYQVKMEKNGVFQINTFYFPGWKYFVNDREVFINPEDDKELGRPRLMLEAGDHKISSKFTNAPVRSLGNSLSAIAWLVLIAYFLSNNIFRSWYKKILILFNKFH